MSYKAWNVREIEIDEHGECLELTLAGETRYIFADDETEHEELNAVDILVFNPCQLDSNGNMVYDLQHVFVQDADFEWFMYKSNTDLEELL